MMHFESGAIRTISTRSIDRALMEFDDHLNSRRLFELLLLLLRIFIIAGRFLVYE